MLYLFTARQSDIYKPVQAPSWAPALHEMGRQASYTHLQGRVKENFNLCLCLWEITISKQADNPDQESLDLCWNVQCLRETFEQMHLFHLLSQWRFHLLQFAVSVPTHS